MTSEERRQKVAEMMNRFSASEIAEKLGVHRATIYRDIKFLKESGLSPPTVEDKVRNAKDKAQRLHERRSDRDLVNRIIELEKELEVATYVETNVGDYTVRHAERSDVPRAVAVAILSDWHCEEDVVSSTVNGMNEFNKEVCDIRVNRYFNHLVKLISMCQKSAQIDTLVLAILGDLVSSNIHEELLESCRLRPADAIIEVLEYLTAGIRYLLDNTDVNLVVPCKVGNHSRMTRRVHIAHEEGNSLEWILYNALAKAFVNESRVEFILDKAYFTYIKVWDNFTLRCSHGHAVRYGGGVGGVTIPLNKAVAQWNKARHADLDLVGHWHTFFDTGQVLLNGSLIGYNAFALRIKASYEPPRQAFCLIDESAGKTLVAPIILDEDR